MSPASLGFHAAQNPQTAQSASKGPFKPFAIQPVHQRTRSLPLTEETAIKISQSPPQPFVYYQEDRATNFSMDSITEDHHRHLDVINNNSSILKQLSKIANNNLLQHKASQDGQVSPLALRKKRHHPVMTNIRSMYHLALDQSTFIRRKHSEKSENIQKLTFYMDLILDALETRFESFASSFNLNYFLRAVIVGFWWVRRLYWGILFVVCF